MCGGYGSRMGNISKNIPKPLVEIDGLPILHHKINNYYKQGYNEFILAVGYKKKLIINYINKTDFPNEIKIEYSDAGEEAGILERIYTANSLFGKNVILTYGDTFTDIQLDSLIHHHKNSDNEVTIVSAPFKNPFGLIKTNINNKVLSFVEKPILQYYIGYAVINKNVFNYISKYIIKEKDGIGIIKLYEKLIKNDKLGSYPFNGLDVTFNTPSELQKAKEKIVNFYTLKEK